MLPRIGGVLDQPADEIVRLEAMLGAFSRWEEVKETRRATRDKNRARHQEATV